MFLKDIQTDQHGQAKYSLASSSLTGLVGTFLSVKRHGCG